VEFSNHIGRPLFDGLATVHNALTGFSLRRQIRLFVSGKVTTGFDVVKRLALGADACYSARSMMLALGCIQALRCNTNHCPTGVATQDPGLTEGLDPGNKAPRVHHYHEELVKSVAEIVGAMGIEHTAQLRPWHIHRRVSDTEVRSYAGIFRYVSDGELLQDDLPDDFAHVMRAASPDTFAPVDA